MLPDERRPNHRRIQGRHITDPLDFPRITGEYGMTNAHATKTAWLLSSHEDGMADEDRIADAQISIQLGAPSARISVAREPMRERRCRRGALPAIRRAQRHMLTRGVRGRSGENLALATGEESGRGARQRASIADAARFAPERFASYGPTRSTTARANERRSPSAGNRRGSHLASPGRRGRATRICADGRPGRARARR